MKREHEQIWVDKKKLLDELVNMNKLNKNVIFRKANNKILEQNEQQIKEHEQQQQQKPTQQISNDIKMNNRQKEIQVAFRSIDKLIEFSFR